MTVTGEGSIVVTTPMPGEMRLMNVFSNVHKGLQTPRSRGNLPFDTLGHVNTSKLEHTTPSASKPKMLHIYKISALGIYYAFQLRVRIIL
jgi:hypothetical protein